MNTRAERTKLIPLRGREKGREEERRVRGGREKGSGERKGGREGGRVRGRREKGSGEKREERRESKEGKKEVGERKSGSMLVTKLP